MLHCVDRWNKNGRKNIRCPEDTYWVPSFVRDKKKSHAPLGALKHVLCLVIFHSRSSELIRLLRNALSFVEMDTFAASTGNVCS